MRDEQKTKQLLDKGSSVFYRLGTYQRKYVWGEKQWRTLWRDIVRIIEDPNYKKHCIGELMFYEHQDPEVTIRDIVNGQQRLTTNTIIFASIRDIVSERDPEYKKNKLYKSICPMLQTEGHNRIELKACDTPAYDAIISCKKLNGYQNSNIVKGYKWFKKQIDAYGRLEEVYKAVCCLTATTAYCESEEEANTQFCRLNSVAMDMTEFDKIRAYLYSAITQENVNRGIIVKNEQRLIKICDHLEDILPKTQDRIEFIHIFLYSEGAYDKYANSTTYIFGPNKIAEKFDDYLTACLAKNKVTETLDNLELFMKFYEELTGNEKIDYYIRTSFRHLSMWMFVTDLLYRYKVNLTVDEFFRALKMWEDILVRRNFMQCNNHAYALAFGIVKAAITSMEKYGIKFIPALIDVMRDKCASAEYGNDYKLLLKEMLNGKTGNNKFKIAFLMRIENYIRGGAENITYNNVQLEHVMPQSWTNEVYVKDIGNITLLDAKLNRMASNNDFIEKKEYYRNSNIELNRYFVNLRDWDEIEIQKRTCEIYKLLLDIWGERYTQEEKDEARSYADEQIAILEIRKSKQAYQEVS